MKKEDPIKSILSNLGIARLNVMQVAANQTISSERNTLLLSPTGSGGPRLSFAHSSIIG